MTWRLWRGRSHLLAAALALASLLGCAARPAPWFRDVAEETGLRFTHVTGATGQFYMPEIMGAGCALLDFDGDGDLDVFLVQGAPFDNPGKGPGNRLFRNELNPSGKLQFTDVTRQAGLGYSGYGMGAATGDFDNDGRVDLLVTNFGANVLYRNNGDGTFRNVTTDSPEVALPGRWSTSASFFDYDRDGWQDLVILTYLDYSIQTNQRCVDAAGERDFCSPKAYRPTAAHLFHNEKGRFVEVTRQSGIAQALGRGLGVVAFDANGDGWPDLFVANDGSPNHLWINQKNGAFAERALESGVAYGEDGLPKAGMGVAVGDSGNTGAEDLLVLNLMREGATLFRNNGRGGFADASLKTGIHAITFPYTGFGVGWFDFDRDGWPDLFLASGAVTLREEQRGQPYPFRERNLLIRNPGRAGGRFLDVTAQAGAVFERLEVSRGAAFGDIDNDGDVDVLVTNNNGPVRLLRNDLPPRHWLAVQIEGAGLGAGARVEVKAAGLPPLWRRVHTDSSYLSASDPRAYFGLGEAAQVESVTVHWPDGSETRQNANVKLNSLFRIHIPQARGQ
jgi:enediyne biosynthesis protein E4